MVNGVGFNSRQQSSKGEYANEGGWGGGGEGEIVIRILQIIIGEFLSLPPVLS